MSRKSVKLTAAIIDRGAGNRAASIFHTYHQEMLLIVRGHGTAGSAVMDCLGLDEPEKDLVFGVSSQAQADCLLKALCSEMEFHKPGHGIAFTLSLTGISAAAMDFLSRHQDQDPDHTATARTGAVQPTIIRTDAAQPTTARTGAVQPTIARTGAVQPTTAQANTDPKEEPTMTHHHSHELIASVIDTDLSTPVMEAARKAGCQGGTLVKARELNADAGRKLFGMTLSQEKAILLILTSAENRQPILRAICETVMKETGEHAIAISLPVDAVEGLAEST